MQIKMIMENWNKFLTEKKDFSNLMNILGARRENIDTVGMMTAENPQAQPLSEEENEKLNKQLEQDLRDRNLGFKKIQGKFGNYENSYLIPNITRDEIIELGRKFDQESVIWGKRKSSEEGSSEEPKDQEDGFVFEYIESIPGKTVEKRDIVDFGEHIQSKQNLFSQSTKGPREKYRLPGKPKNEKEEKEQGLRVARLRARYGDEGEVPEAKKFYIPFFDDSYEIVKEHCLSNPEYDGILLEEINQRTRKILEPNRTEKSRWFNRGIIKELRKKTWQ